MSDQHAETEIIKPTHIGGQAVLEGIMMRGKYNWAIAVREPGGTIYTETHDLVSAAAKHAYLKLPIIRGMWGFYETMTLAIKAFGISAAHAGETEDERLSSGEIGFTMVFGMALAIALFIVVPALVTTWIVGSATENPFTWNVVDGIFRLAVFFLYIYGVSRMKEIRRVFAYHGAEHKTIHAYERGLPLETGIIKRYTTLHVRCGTSFLLMVMVVAIIVFSLFPGKAILAALGVEQRFWILVFSIAMRILLLPLIAGIAYEITVKWAGKRPDNPVVKVLLWPGLQMQRLTTVEPDDDMIEIAVAAMNLVVEREEAETAAVGAASGPVAAPVPALD